MKSLSRLSLASAFASLVAACASNPSPQGQADAKGATIATTQSSPAPTPAAPSPVRPTSPEIATNTRNAAGQSSEESRLPGDNSIYFDFDRFVIRSDFDELIRRHAAFAGEHKSGAVQIQGHADERGSREYNLALGQKRADAVRDRLVLHGISARRIETVSYGEERPKAPGHDESSWAQNRRGDISHGNQ